MNVFHKAIMMDIDTSNLKRAEAVVIVETVKLGTKKVSVESMENKYKLKKLMIQQSNSSSIRSNLPIISTSCLLIDLKPANKLVI